MKSVENKIASTPKATKTRKRNVPLIVPHGAAAAGRDFESAFEVLPRDERERELWSGAKQPFARAS